MPSLLAVDSVSSLAASSWLDYLPPFDGTSYPPERGLAHACAVAKGRLYCWGDSLVGAMGVGLPGRVILPTAVIVRSDGYPQQVAVSRESTCVRLTDGSIQCTGDDTFGQLGRGADAGRFAEFFTPASAFVGHAVAVAMSDTTTCALVQGGKVLCWGGNRHGELGQGTTDEVPHHAPLAVRF
jgi:alpha-tubulin suppressor-like RCC1 family protein